VIAHRFVKVIGLCNPRAAGIVVECSCGFVAEARSFAAAAAKFEAHVQANGAVRA
jgi:hypothetical protein